MSRRTRRKYYKRRSGKWSSNILRINQPETAPGSGSFYNSVTIAQNNTTTSQSTITQSYTVKNVEVSALLEATGNIDNLAYYIIYVPQGYPIGSNLPFQHPEWILAYKFIGKNSSPSYANSPSQPIKVRTRLARKLDSGDSIIFFYDGNNTGNDSVGFTMQGLIRWWTKAN